MLSGSTDKAGFILLLQFHIKKAQGDNYSKQINSFYIEINFHKHCKSWWGGKTDRCACISIAILKLHRQFCSSGITVHLKCLLEGHHKSEAFCHIDDNLPKVTPSGNSSWRSKSSPKAYKNSKTIKASPKISGGSLVFTGIGTGSSYNPKGRREYCVWSLQNTQLTKNSLWF